MPPDRATEFKMDFIISKDYEPAVREIKLQTLPYYQENGLEWARMGQWEKLDLYRKTNLFQILDEEVVGFIMFHERDSQMFLAELHIQEEYRNRGYGAKALEKAKNYAASMSHQRLVIQAFKSSPAYDLYLRNGFSLDSEQPYTFRLVADTV